MSNLKRLSRRGQHTVFRGEQLPPGIIWKEETEAEIELKKLCHSDYCPFKGGGYWRAYDQYPKPKVLLYEGSDYQAAINAYDAYHANTRTCDDQPSP